MNCARELILQERAVLPSNKLLGWMLDTAEKARRYYVWHARRQGLPVDDYDWDEPEQYALAKKTTEKFAWRFGNVSFFLKYDQPSNPHAAAFVAVPKKRASSGGWVHDHSKLKVYLNFRELLRKTGSSLRDVMQHELVHVHQHLRRAEKQPSEFVSDKKAADRQLLRSKLKLASSPSDVMRYYSDPAEIAAYAYNAAEHLLRRFGTREKALAALKDKNVLRDLVMGEATLYSAMLSYPEFSKHYAKVRERFFRQVYLCLLKLPARRRVAESWAARLLETGDVDDVDQLLSDTMDIAGYENPVDMLEHRYGFEPVRSYGDTAARKFVPLKNSEFAAEELMDGLGRPRRDTEPGYCRSVLIDFGYTRTEDVAFVRFGLAGYALCSSREIRYWPISYKSSRGLPTQHVSQVVDALLRAIAETDTRQFDDPYEFIYAVDKRWGRQSSRIINRRRRKVAEDAADTGPEKITAAAVRIGDVTYSGFDHVDAYYDMARATSVPFERVYATGEEGFLTSRGRFVDRDEAYEIALGAQQCRPDPHGCTWLNAENVLQPL